MNTFSILLAVVSAQNPVPTPPKPLPGTYVTSWVGNTFAGDGGPNGQGFWVQNSADEIEVTPDGTVIAGSDWDEAGRCLGLHREGKVNQNVLKASDELAESAWGWGTGNHAIAVDGNRIYAANTGGKLLVFNWTPGDLESPHFARGVELARQAESMSAQGGKLAIASERGLEVFQASDLAVVWSKPTAMPRDLAYGPDGRLWVLTENALEVYDAKGQRVRSLSGMTTVTAVSVSSNGQVVLCDSGPRQTVRILDAQGKLIREVGEVGGLLSGIPGELQPQKLFGLRGAGLDRAGNLYVAMGYAPGPSGNLIVRSLAPDGRRRWEVQSFAFVDTFSFDPERDGREVYGRTARFTLDLDKTKPGTEWRAAGMTLDPLDETSKGRMLYGATALLRRPGGKRLLFTIGQYAGGYSLYTFDKGDIARRVDEFHAGDKWAWDISNNGDIWHGDADGMRILRYPFLGWMANGRPRYNWKEPEAAPWPQDWALIRRVQYLEDRDAMLITGYLDGERIETWGVAGSTARMYRGWRRGDRRLVWTAKLPRDANDVPNEGPLTPQSVDVAGDYLFAGMVKPVGGKILVHVLALADGRHVGTLVPGPSTGEAWGWLDMPYAVQALKRKNGEYLVLVEEDHRGKNLLYRWKPPVAKD